MCEVQLGEIVGKCVSLFVVWWLKAQEVDSRVLVQNLSSQLHSNCSYKLGDPF